MREGVPGEERTLVPSREATGMVALGQCPYLGEVSGMVALGQCPYPGEVSGMVALGQGLTSGR